MLDFFRNKWWRYSAEGAFLVWGMIVVSLYFYCYPSYGFSFLLIVEVSLYVCGIMAILAGIFFMAFLILGMTGHPVEKGVFIKKILQRLSWERKEIQFSYLFFPFFIYACSFLWILYIFKRSRDLSIVVNDLYSLVVITVLTIIAFSLGYRLLKLFKFQFSDWLEKFLLSEAIGFGTLMVIMYFLGMAHLYYRSVAYALVGLIVTFTYKEIIELWSYARNNKVTWHLQPLVSFKNFLIVAVALIIGVYAAGIFHQYPIGFDALISYLTYPKEYVASHGIINFPHWIYFGFPQNGEMLFTLGFLLFNFQISLGIVYVFTLLTLLLIVYFFRKFNWEGSALACFLFLYIPVISYQNFSDHKVEIIFAFYVALSYALFFIYLKEKTVKNLVVFSVVCGIAAGLKYFFLGWYIIPLALFLMANFFRKKISFKEMTIWAGIILILMIPWFYKNIKFSGNPVDPIFSSQLASREFFYNSLGNDSQSFIVREMRNEGLLIWDDEEDKNWGFFLRLPFSITFLNNKKFFSDGINLGFLLLLFFPLIFILLGKVKQNKYEIERKIIWSVAILLLGWVYVGHLVMWYAVAIFIFCSIIAARAMHECRAYRYAKFGSMLFMFIWSMVFLLSQLYMRFYQVNAFMNKTAGENIISMSDYLNRYRNSDGLIWGVDEVRGYYIEKSNERFIPDNYLLAMSYLLKNNSEEEVIGLLRDKKIELFLYRSDQEYSSERINWSYSPNGSEKYAKFTRDNYMRFFKFRDKYLELAHRDGDLFLYRLKDGQVHAK